MYKIDQIWNEFYEELDPEIRTQLYDQIVETAQDDGANAYRRELLHKRYDNPKDPQKKYPFDLFLQQCVILPMVYKRRRWITTNVKRETKRAVEAFDLEREHTEAEKAALYWELRNTAKRYFSTCHSAAYGKTMMGMKDASPAEKRVKVLQEAWNMSVGIGKISGMSDLFEVFAQAVREELEIAQKGYGVKFDTYSEK